MTFFIFGAGFSARAFARSCHAPLYGTTRNKDNFTLLQKSGITPLLFPNDDQKPLYQALEQTTHLIVSTAPDQTGDPVLQKCDLLSHTPKLQWICYLSTIGVYGDHQGAWIDETAPCSPSLKRNLMRLECEQAWLDFAKQRQCPIAILRLGGIYGNGRNPFIKLQKGEAKCIIKAGQVFNRIHVDDIAGVIHYFAGQKQHGLFNLVDHHPAPPQDVISYAAKLMHIAPPAEIAFEEAEMSAMARSFYADNKRVSNQKLQQSGYQLCYTDYEMALSRMWRDGVWQGE